MEELKQLASEVPDSYYDFVVDILAVARDYPNRFDDIVNYLKEHKDMETSDILEWIFTEIEGIDLNNPPELILVDDDEDE